MHPVADLANAVRRRLEQTADRAWASARHRLAPGPQPRLPGGDPTVGIVTVNASTTRYLKLMLTTLADQDGLDRVAEVVVVDNASRDGGVPFLRRLARAVPRVRLVELRHFPNHARGLRAGERALDPAATVVLYCDPDVIWRDPATLRALTDAMTAQGAALAGEPRRPTTGAGSHPDIQASFLAVRRDVLHRRDVPPPVNDGSPTARLQAGIVRAGLPIVPFPSNAGGYILHRGRTAVAAARTATPWRSYATTPNRLPHYMGIPGGAEIWAEVEQRHAGLLAEGAEARLIAHLADRLGHVGT